MIAVYLMRADGTHVHRVTQRHAHAGTIRHHREDEQAEFSPDGTRLVFQRGDDTRLVDGEPLHAILTVRRDGTHVRRLTPWRLDAGYPDWSPNGRWITFKSQVEGRRQSNVWLVHPNGTDLHRITHTFGGTYTWGPRPTKLGHAA